MWVQEHPFEAGRVLELLVYQSASMVLEFYDLSSLLGYMVKV